ncbi:hypothetical protein V8C44DRAFT_321464 [Trichoderma aethiopicum]
MRGRGRARGRGRERIAKTRWLRALAASSWLSAMPLLVLACMRQQRIRSAAADCVPGSRFTTEQPSRDDCTKTRREPCCWSKSSSKRTCYPAGFQHASRCPTKSPTGSVF